MQSHFQSHSFAFFRILFESSRIYFLLNYFELNYFPMLNTRRWKNVQFIYCCVQRLICYVFAVVSEAYLFIESMHLSIFDRVCLFIPLVSRLVGPLVDYHLLRCGLLLPKSMVSKQATAMYIMIVIYSYTMVLLYLCTLMSYSDTQSDIYTNRQRITMWICLWPNHYYYLLAIKYIEVKCMFASIDDGSLLYKDMPVWRVDTKFFELFFFLFIYRRFLMWATQYFDSYRNTIHV